MSYVVIFRTGGFQKWHWNRSVPFHTQEEAFTSQAVVEKMGYVAHVEDYERSIATGLPSTFKYGH